MMSFTIYCKGHTIYAGPERARRSPPEFRLQTIAVRTLGVIPVKSTFKIKSFYLQKL